MDQDQKFYRTVFTVEVLSSEPVHFMNLSEVSYEITRGGSSGKVNVGESVEVSREEMAQLLLAQGSDPEFLLGYDEDEPEDEANECED